MNRKCDRGAKKAGGVIFTRRTESAVLGKVYKPLPSRAEVRGTFGETKGGGLEGLFTIRDAARY